MIRFLFAGLLLMLGAEAAVAQDSLSVVQTVQPDSADLALDTQLERILAQVPAFEGIEVDVTAGVAALSGTAVNAQAATDAAELVRGIDGVVYVVDGVEANVEVEARVTPAVERVQEYVRKAIAYLPLIGVAVVVFMVFVLLGWWISRWEAPFRRLGLSTLARNLIRRTLRLIVLLTGLLLVLDILGVTALVGAVLGAAGLLGVAIGFAFQDIVENYLAGVLLSVRQPFALGDAVRIGDEEGKVMRLTARELLLMTYDGNHFRIPNASVFK
ncbi:MAG: mechanosensitive ion channel domain-containing protein, partial [Bacteroidota bacterium]